MTNIALEERGNAGDWAWVILFSWMGMKEKNKRPYTMQNPRSG